MPESRRRLRLPCEEKMGIRNMARVRGLALNGDVLGLIQVLSDRLRSGPEGRVAAAALGDLRDKRAVEPLVSVFDHDKVCATAVRALAAIGDPIAAAPFGRALLVHRGPHGAQRG